MKKKSYKLVLKRETLRALVDGELARVPGAWSPVTVDSCPPCLARPDGKDVKSTDWT